MSDPADSSPKPTAALAILAILLMALYRLAPHPWNLAPTGALFLLGGLYLGHSWRGWALPFGALLASDALLYWRSDAGLWRPERLVDYLAFALVGLIGRAAARGGAGLCIVAIAASPLVFYVVSNGGVWVFDRALYPLSFQGLVQCYVAGLPFLRGTLVGDWLFAGIGVAAVQGLPYARPFALRSANSR